MNRYSHSSQNKSGDSMRISFIKYEKEQKYGFPKIVGMNVEEIIEPEQVDDKIKELKDKKYTTIIISNELASFSDKIINKYKNDGSINIVIMP